VLGIQFKADGSRSGPMAGNADYFQKRKHDVAHGFVSTEWSLRLYVPFLRLVPGRLSALFEAGLLSRSKLGHPTLFDAVSAKTFLIRLFAT